MFVTKHMTCMQFSGCSGCVCCLCSLAAAQQSLLGDIDRLQMTFGCAVVYVGKADELLASGAGTIACLLAHMHFLEAAQ